MFAACSFAQRLVRCALLTNLLLPVGVCAEQSQHLFDRLTKGGLVVYVRHTHTGRGVDLMRHDVAAQGLADCSRQRDLDAVGEDQARDIGKALRAAGVPVGEVISSPYCRAWKTAELAFPRHPVKRDDGLATVCQASGTDWDRRRARLINFLSAPVAGGNRFLVSHNCNIRALSKRLVDECARVPSVGDAALFEPKGNGEFVELGCIALKTFSERAR
jgi:phosphohistidine phosphatase SixA